MKTGLGWVGFVTDLLARGFQVQGHSLAHKPIIQSCDPLLVILIGDEEGVKLM